MCSALLFSQAAEFEKHDSDRCVRWITVWGRNLLIWGEDSIILIEIYEYFLYSVFNYIRLILVIQDRVKCGGLKLVFCSRCIQWRKTWRQFRSAFSMKWWDQVKPLQADTRWGRYFSQSSLSPFFSLCSKRKSCWMWEEDYKPCSSKMHPDSDLRNNANCCILDVLKTCLHA